jgi:DNA primase
LRGIDLLLEGGLNVKAVVFPEGEDPDSYSRKVGSQAFQDYLKENSRDFIGFKISLYQDEIDKDPIRKAGVIREVVLSISKIPDPIIRSVYAKEASGLLSIEEEILHAELNKILLKTQKEQFERAREEKAVEDSIDQLLPAPVETSAEDNLLLQEREMLRLLLNYGGQKLDVQELHFCQYILSEIKEVSFQTPVYQKMIQLYREQISLGQVPSDELFLNHGDAEIRQESIAMITQRHEVSTNWKDKFQIFVALESDDLADTAFKSILRLKRRLLQKMMEEAMIKIKEAEQLQLAEEKVNELLEVYLELKKLKLKIDKELGIVIG